MTPNSYSNKLRVRSCGLLVEQDKLLLAELLSPVTNQWTWIPPGGGVQFGETLEEALRREFREETGLQVSAYERVHVNEIISPPYHAIEFYFLVKRQKGEMIVGADPERKADEQIIRNVGFFSEEEMQSMNIAPVFIKKEFWKSMHQ